jgi:hypothetical protein
VILLGTDLPTPPEAQTLATIEAVYLAFPGGTQETLLLDSLEWFRD